ncbi:MAG: 3-oxoacyl-[acyl-carrier-protein] reductase [Bacteroidales bacterium]|nr:3-oxoacyl-[acyl-carrier-protein] reductase [Bacteroidales bacterium]
MGLLNGKTALITGASRGIGRNIALAFAKEGANIIFTSTNRNENVISLEEELSSLGAKFLYFEADAKDLNRANEIVDEAVKEFERIDILVNNAGITADTLLMRMTEEQWDSVIGTNLKSVFNYTKAVQKVMLKQRSGSIVNISSVVGIAGNAGQANYSASKAGIIGFTKSVAKELGSRNVRCNAIAPGFIMSDMTLKLSEEQRKAIIDSIPLKRAGLPEDVANAAIFLASDMASYISGEVINVSGAMLT